MKKTIVVALSDNRVIGSKNALPWRLSADLKHFKEVTMGKPMIMGRKTFDSIGRPLPGRRTVVVTRQSDWSCDGVDVADSFEAAIGLAESVGQGMSSDELMIVGGAEIYRQSMLLVDRLLVTEVHAQIDGDAFFPEVLPAVWRESSRNHFESDDKNDYSYSFVEYDKK